MDFSMVPMQLSARALKTTMAQAAKATKTAAPSQMVMDGADSASWPEQTEDEANAKPQFEALSARQMKAGKTETRRIFVPPHRYTPLKQNWEKIYGPLVEQLQLQVRMNLKRRSIELRTSDHTVNAGALQKGDDFCRAFTLGFELQDAIALLRLDDLYIHTFEIHDVKQMLAGDHMSRAIGRVAGKGGKTKFTIENATKTRIVMAETKIHILGSYSNGKIARDAICQLILGAPPGKVYNKLRLIAGRMSERF